MNKGIHTRGYLPHWDFAKSLQAVTFRLADSVPARLIIEWKREVADLPDDEARAKALHRRISHFEDAGQGTALLGDPSCAEIVQRKLLEGDPDRYHLFDWCVMPNHVHVLFKLAEGVSLGPLVQSWKGGSALEINRLLGRIGTLWMADYYDRLIRDMAHFHECRSYIRNNPVKAGLCENPEDWPFSSAHLTERGLQSAADISEPPPNAD